MGGQLGGPFVKPRTQNHQKLLASRQSVNLIRNSTGKQTRSWVIAGAAVSCLAQQLSEMAEGAFQLQGHQPASIMQQSATRSVRNRNFACARHGRRWMVAELLWTPIPVRHPVCWPALDCNPGFGGCPTRSCSRQSCAVSDVWRHGRLTIQMQTASVMRSSCGQH